MNQEKMVAFMHKQRQDITLQKKTIERLDKEVERFK